MTSVDLGDVYWDVRGMFVLEPLNKQLGDHGHLLFKKPEKGGRKPGST